MNERRESREQAAADLARKAWFARLAFGVAPHSEVIPKPELEAVGFDVMP